MVYRFLADAVLVIHGVFIIFVIAGGLLALRWPRVAWLHIPAAAWGALIEFTGWICPLTPLENYFLDLADATPYREDFIAHYLLPVIYPAALTPSFQAVLGAFVIILNCCIYAVVLLRMKRHHLPP